MKKILVLFFGLFLFSITTQAQTAADDADHATETSKGEKMKALLGLSDEQTTKFREVVVERRAAIKAVKDDTALAADAKEAKLKAIDASREAKFKTIFSPEQFEKWKAHNEQKKKD
jgi:secreted trypsin-like serine protease